MTRFLTGTFAALALAAFTAVGAPTVSAHTSGTMHSAKMKHSCPAGDHWVKGYVRDGKKVHGYCRK